MITMRTEDIWWKRLSNPAKLTENIVDSLIENRSVAVVYNEKIPWKDVFTEAIIEGIEQYNASMRNSIHSVENGIDPGEYLMQKYCNREEQGKYWKPSGTRAKFLANSKTTTLNKSNVFIDLATDAVGWIKFVDEYTSYFKKDEEHGLFVIFTKDKNITKSKYIDCYYYEENINEFDTLLLCMTVLSEKKYSLYEKQYISEVAVSIAENDVVLAGKIAEIGLDIVKYQYNAVKVLLNENGIDFQGDELKIKTAMWQAQVKVLFPVLEQYRCRLISKYKENIEMYLYGSEAGNYKTNNIYELEIGGIFHICKNHHILPKNEFDSLCKVRDARNSLAHWDVIPFEKIAELLSLPK